ncbi:putative permease [compost metagenome]|jgi:uncharacterized membrane protein YraQ (UPF0718 family)
MTVASRPLPRPLAYLVKIDRVILAIAAILVAVAFADPPQLAKSLQFMGGSISNTVWFLVASIALAAYSKASGADNLIGAAFQGKTSTAIIAAAVVGAVTPFCSCGVIPVVAALLAIGVPLGPVMAFWVSSPLMDPAMFMITTATLGLEFAVAKTIASIVIAILSGAVAAAFVRAGLVTTVLQPHIGNGGCAASKIRNPKAVVWKMWGDPARRETFLEGFKSNGFFLGKWLLLAFVLESLMVAYMPMDFASAPVFKEGFLPIVIATLVGIPSYLNGYAALPLVHGLLDQGLAPGAAMAFLISGGVTSIPAAMAVWVVATRRVFALYIGLGITGSLLSGVVYAAWMAA